MDIVINKPGKLITILNVHKPTAARKELKLKSKADAVNYAVNQMVGSLRVIGVDRKEGILILDNLPKRGRMVKVIKPFPVPSPKEPKPKGK